MNTIEDIFAVINQHQRFVILSHIRPDGDAIGSTIALGSTLEGMGKDVTYMNEDGVPESLMFLNGSDKIEQPSYEVLDVEIMIAVDCANKPRLGEKSLQMAANAKLCINIDHHKSNSGYGDLNYIDANSPATGQIIYQMITQQGLALTDVARDSIYVAVSTDTGSFQYSNTTATTYEMAADLIRRGLDTGKINEQLYDSFPYRRLALIRELLNTLEISSSGELADWQLLKKVKLDLNLKPDDSEGLINMMRSIQGVNVALFFEELMDESIRVSIRAKTGSIDACDIAQVFGGGGHTLAAGIRMSGPISEARRAVIREITKYLS
jgi:phosphoesterase RecJ-like protein